MSPLLIVALFDQTMSLIDFSLIRPPPLMLYRAVDAEESGSYPWGSDFSFQLREYNYIGANGVTLEMISRTYY